MRLSKIGEFCLLENLKKTLPIGEDAYIIPQKDKGLLFCCDTSVEGRHFLTSLSSFYEIGYRSCASCISDIAAMGGNPLYCLIALGVPGDYELSAIFKIYAGMKDIAAGFDMKIVGGDTIESEKLIITVSILGSAENPIARSGSKPGDLIGVTGRLGGAKKGLEVLKKGLQGFENLKKRYLMPTPRIKEGLILKDIATSMIDISDGLILDLYHLSTSSNNGMSIKKDIIPIEEGASFDDVIYSDDYELLFTFPSQTPFPKFATIIGEVVDEKGVFLDGEKIEAKGYEHFREI
ncbi:MAG: thiamine-phosphate kinase [bacterium]